MDRHKQRDEKMFTRFAIEVTKTTLIKGHDEFLTVIGYFAGTYVTMNGRIKITDTVRKTFSTENEAQDRIKTLPAAFRTEKSISTFSMGVRAIEYTHANQNGYSDTTPFEIVRVVSDKTIELRSMTTERAADWKPEFVAGGFAGHCTNNGDQRNAWVIKSDADGYNVRARLQKDGSWKSSHGRHSLHTAPIMHHDYNF